MFERIDDLLHRILGRRINVLLIDDRRLHDDDVIFRCQRTDLPKEPLPLLFAELFGIIDLFMRKTGRKADSGNDQRTGDRPASRLVDTDHMRMSCFPVGLFIGMFNLHPAAPR